MKLIYAIASIKKHNNCSRDYLYTDNYPRGGHASQFPALPRALPAGRRIGCLGLMSLNVVLFVVLGGRAFCTRYDVEIDKLVCMRRKRFEWQYLCALHALRTSRRVHEMSSIAVVQIPGSAISGCRRDKTDVNTVSQPLTPLFMSGVQSPVPARASTRFCSSRHSGLMACHHCSHFGMYS